MKTIRVRCQGAESIDLDQLIELQGELKSLSEENYRKLRQEIVSTGYAFPIRCWKKDGTYTIIGGHQTKRVLMKMRDEEGYLIPSLPVSLVEADSLHEAKRRVLQDVSQYGDVDKQGLYQFTVDAMINPVELSESFKIPDLDMPSFHKEFFDDDISEHDDKENQHDDGEKFCVLVTCEDEQEQVKFLNEILERGMQCKTLIA